MIGATVRVRASLAPLGGARKAVSFTWLRGCRPAPTPAGAVLDDDGVLTWTPGWDGLGDHVVQVNASGDPGRELVLAVRPDPPGSLCHDDTDTLELKVDLAEGPPGSAAVVAAVHVRNKGAVPVKITQVVSRGVASPGAPDTLYPAVPDDAVLAAGASATWSVTFCAYASVHLPDRPARYLVTVVGEVPQTKEPLCAAFVSDARPIPGAEPALPGRELPEFEESARLLGLMHDDVLTKSLMVADFNRDGLFDLAMTQMGEGAAKPRVFFAVDDQLHYVRQPDLESTANFGIAAGLVDTWGHGLMDVVQATWPDPTGANAFAGIVQLFRNDGKGQFTRDSDALTPAKPTAGRNVNVLDYDNDGFEDFYLTAWGGYPSIDESRPEALNHPTDVLYHNEANGSFAQVTAAAKAEGLATSMGLVILDANEDGWPDIWIGAYGTPKLLLNNADGTFRDQPQDVSKWPYAYLDPKQPGAKRFEVWATGFGDFNADGHTDIVGGAWLERALPGPPVPHHLWLGDGKGNFKLEWEQSNLGRGDPCLSWAMGLQVGDLNDDGYPEIFFGGGGPQGGWHHQLFLNATAAPGQVPHFADRTLHIDYPASGSRSRYPYRGHGGTMVDLDGDLDLDFIQTNGGMEMPGVSDPGSAEAWRAFMNLGTGHGKLELDLEGYPSNFGAVGARVDIALSGGTGPTALRQWMFPNNGFPGTHLPGRIHFGLGDAKQIDGVQVTWPDGQVTTHATPINKRLALKEKDFLRFGAKFRGERDGFVGGGSVIGGALCVDGGAAASRAVASGGVGSSLALRIDFPTGSAAGQTATMKLGSGTTGVTVTLQGQTLQITGPDGKTKSGELPALGPGRRVLARAALELNPSGKTDAVVYLDAREALRMTVGAVDVTSVVLGGKGVCYGMVSLR